MKSKGETGLTRVYEGKELKGKTLLISIPKKSRISQIVIMCEGALRLEDFPRYAIGNFLLEK